MGSTCLMCPDNKIKPVPGDATDCDITCDGESNDEHTACGKTILFHKINRRDSLNYHKTC